MERTYTENAIEFLTAEGKPYATRRFWTGWTDGSGCEVATESIGNARRINNRKLLNDALRQLAAKHVVRPVEIKHKETVA